MKEFTSAVGAYLGVNSASIRAHIKRCVSRPLPLSEAKELVSTFGTCLAALQAVSREA
jgi:hypothetical protein